MERQQGYPHCIQTLEAGYSVGEVDFFRGAVYHTTATVDVPSTLYRLTADRFQQMQQEKPEIAAAFQSAVIGILGDRLTAAHKEVADLLES